MSATFLGPLSTVFGVQAAGRSLDALLRDPDHALPIPTAAEWAEAADPRTIAEVLERAHTDLAAPWPLPLASAAARVHRDGDRDNWERAAFARQRRLSRAVVAAAVTLDERWIDEVADGVVLLCEQSSWCWPAHDDAFWKRGAVLASVDDPYLDLGAGEVVAQLAWIDQLLGGALDDHYPGLRTRIRLESRRRVIEPFLTRRDWHWLGLDGDVHNWNPWIHGNVLVAALRLLDSPDDAADRLRSVALAIEGLDRYVASLPEDGAIDEGYAYWWNGACRALEALDILAHATGGVLDATPAIESLRQTVAFPHRVHLGENWYLNLADGQARPRDEQPWHALHRAATRVGDADARAHAAAHRHPDRAAATEWSGLGRLLRGAVDADWLAATGRSPLPRHVWFGSTQVLLTRERAGSARGLTVAAKGGHNAEHHNHNDVGSVVVASDGVPVIVDAGRPTYTRATFGPERYSIWTMQSSWHSVPEVRGVPQGVGAGFTATRVVAREAGASTAISMDLAAAYPVGGLTSWRREVRLDRGPEPRVVIEDAWSLEPWSAGGEEPPTTVHMLIAGEIELGAGRALVTPLAGATPVILRWDDGVPATVTVRHLDDPMLSEVWGPRLTRLELLVTRRDRVAVTVELSQSIREDAP